MLFVRASLGLLLSSALVAVPAAATRQEHPPAKPSHAKLAAGRHGAHAKTVSRSRKGRTVAKRGHVLRGQQAIQPERVTEIQQALIREHYMSGEASGQWDTTTQAAMQKFQADQGWQTKLMPDSRALKKLGLGADYSSAINARTGSFNDPPPASSIPAAQAEGFAAAAGTNH
jgi:peptidoglycan hydrolase-like protein with peptidoglycan-binding domain